MKNALPPGSNFTTCAVGIEQFPANMMSCLLGGNMRVGMEDNTRMPNGELAKGSYEQVEWAVRAAESLNRKPATPAEARQIMGIRKDVNRKSRSENEEHSGNDNVTNIPHRFTLRRGNDQRGRRTMDFAISDEQRMFRDTVYRFAKEEIAPLCEEADLKSEFSFEIWRKFGEMGLLGLPVPEKYGGAGADFVTCCLAGEAVGYAGVDGGHTLAWGAHTYLCAANIMQHGTEAQKEKYLPKLATGEWIGCMGLTEPGCGSDAAALTTTAVRKGDKYILNGSKTFITNAPLAQVFVVFATLDK